MEFETVISGEKYLISPLNKTTFLVSGNRAEYILYKTAHWNCADEIPFALLMALGNAIDMQPVEKVHSVV